MSCRKITCPKRALGCAKRDPALLTRRDWVRLFVLGTATQLGLGNIKPQRLLATLAPSTNNSCVLPVNLSSFPALQSPGGSQRIRFSTYLNGFILTRAQVEDPPGVFTDVFYAFDSSCTHESTAVNAYNVGDDLMTCTNHGSTYDIMGNVVFAAGGVDQANLKRLPVAFDGDNLVEVELNSSFNPTSPTNDNYSVAISALPTIPLRVSNLAVQSVLGAVTRWKLTFPAVRRASYRIKYYADFAQPPQTPFPYFTMAVGGTATTNAIIYNPTTGSASMPSNSTYYVNSNFNVWVELPSSTTKGFFAVEMVFPI